MTRSEYDANRALADMRAAFLTRAGWKVGRNAMQPGKLRQVAPNTQRRGIVARLIGL